ncbi:MAG: FKBP-type peptidyl-prolyl cis-trans isomerase [Flavobacteriales bacterium]|nr:FKBP-type peptidyl-prolyl cis-trans isomerase [Flavobacteriales bacterium]
MKKDIPTVKDEVQIQKEDLIDVNRNWIRDESFLIDQFCIRHNLDVVKTNSGVRYCVYNQKKTNKIETGNIVTIDYEVRLLDADTTLCYSSKNTQPFSFIVEMDNIESGLHEAISYFKKGENGVVILPHYLAHGLLGNMDKIPPLSAVLYNIEVIDVKRK